MSEEYIDQEVEDNDNGNSQLAAVEGLEVGQLRKYAKLMNITAQRTWTKEDYITAIKERQMNNTIGVVFDSGSAPKPGFSRLVIHRDPSPGHKNSPVHAGYNGAIYQIPRGLEVDVPTPIVGSIQNAKSLQIVSGDNSHDGYNGSGHTKEQMQHSYPFQVIASTPGKAANQHDNRANSYKDRKAFVDQFGRWPTHGELQEAIKARLIRSASAI